MGLFSFIKDAGEKLLGWDDDEKEQQAAEAADAAKAGSLVKMVTGLGLEVENLAVQYADGVATVNGTASSQADREKVILVLGNTQGVSQVDDRMVVSAPEPEAKFYTVQSGDSLSKIAKEFYGDPMKYPVIFEANKPMLSDPNKIYPNQVLRIPPLD